MNHINFNQLFLALNRYEDNSNYYTDTSSNCFLLNGLECDEATSKGCLSFLKPYQESIWSQDAWIWKSNYLHFNDINEYEFNLGIVKCDNHLAYLLDNDEYMICNPSQLLCINHYDILSIKKDKYGISKGNISKNRDTSVNHNTLVFLENIDDIPDQYTIKSEKQKLLKHSHYFLEYHFTKTIEEININESQIISSSYFDTHFNSKHCLFSNDHYWRPDDTDQNPYIQFNFENLYNIVVVDLKGKSVDQNDRMNAYIKNFKISYVNKHGEWINEETIYQGITIQNGNYIKRIYLDHEIYCSKIRIYPVDFYNIKALKMRLFHLIPKRCNVYDYLITNPNHPYIDLNYLTKNTKLDYKYIEKIQSNNNCIFNQYTKNHYIENLIKQPIEEGICIMCCVMNRTENILKNIHTWLKQNVNQIIIVDWSSKENFYKQMTKINDPRILYVYVDQEETYIRSFAQNLGASLCKYNKLFKIDSDIILYNDFFEKHPLNEGEFYVGDFTCARDENEKSLHGNMYLFIDDYFRINGYNEYIKTYGWDDSDFTIRLNLCGLKKKIFNMDLLYHVPHGDELRVSNSKKDPPLVTIFSNYFCLKKMNLLWSPNYHLQHFTIEKKNEHYILCSRNKEKWQYSYNEDIYHLSRNESIKMVFSWFKNNKKPLYDFYFQKNDYNKMLEILNHKTFKKEDGLLKKNFNNYEIIYYDNKWQEPVITEKQIFQNILQKYSFLPFHYFAFPWASYIDNIWIHKYNELENIINDEIDYHYVIDSNKTYFTVLQHISFREYINVFKKLNIRYIFTPHKMKSDVEFEKMHDVQLIPISLFPKQKNDLSSFIDIQNRKYLTSFIGQVKHKNMLNDIRSNIIEFFQDKSDCYILKKANWHYNNIVYDSIKTSEHDHDEHYKNLLMDSQFSLCPSGTGPNSIRLWESLSFGSIPVILSDDLVLPELPVQYEDFCILWKENEIEHLYDHLKNINIEVKIKMSLQCIEMYKKYFCPENMHEAILHFFDNLKSN